MRRQVLCVINCSYLMLMFSYQHEESTCTFTLHVGEEKERSIYSICFIHSAREFTCVHFSIRFPKKVERKSQVIDALSCLVSGRESKSLFTARKLSLGQGNVFIGVCLSTGPSMHHRSHDQVEGVCIRGLEVCIQGRRGSASGGGGGRPPLQN